MMRFELSTKGTESFVDITPQVRQAVSASRISSGICVVHCPHTTAGLTVNENADPAVVRDILFVLNQAVPPQGDYRHMEGNSAAHIKSSLMGSSCQLLIENGSLVLGTWQSIFFCEFDGPRRRHFMIQIIQA